MTRRYEYRPKDMTYILGSVCSDGVVLVADRKIMLQGGAFHEYRDKLFVDTPWMVVGSSGTLGLFEKFREKLTVYLQSPEYDSSLFTLVTGIETITRELNDAYCEVLQGEQFNVLLGIQSTTDASLKYVYPFGFAEPVRRYKVIGHGEPYGSFFLKRWWHENMTMLEVAELGTFVIKYIQEYELDNTVGVGNDHPQVILIPTPAPTGSSRAKAPTPHKAPAPAMNLIAARVSKRLAVFGEMSWENLTSES
jgi:20S proteasome alpha/beta subunit